MKKRYYFFFLFLIACNKDLPVKIDPQKASSIQRPEGWTALSHSKDVDPQYNILFSDQSIPTINIQLTAMWDSVQHDMERRTATYFGGKLVPNVVKPPPVGGLDFVSGDPIFVTTTVGFNNKVYQNVGFRLKGNASLSGSWSRGNFKLPFKLKFDEFEDRFANIKNQRIYGFKELSFAPSYGDNSFMKDKILNDLFRENGVPAVRTNFCKVYIDFGQGPKYCGVYQMMESVEDAMTKTQYGNNDGNVYKPESAMATFVMSQFEKQNNKDLANFTDIQGFISILNSPTRIADRKMWKKQLEAVFDVDLFLKWLAINTTVQNWDTYGVLTHNYFMYNHKGKLRWIPYDLNLAFQATGGANNARKALSFSLNEVGANWPLIKNLKDDEGYMEIYKKHLKAFVNGDFVPAKLNKTIDAHVLRIKPHIVGVGGEVAGYSHLGNHGNFESAVNTLKTKIVSRHAEGVAFLNAK